MNETPKRPGLRWFQYSLRTLLLAMLLASIAMSWVAVKVQRGREQKEAVKAIKSLGGEVHYDYEFDASGGEPIAPAWLRSILGEDCFAIVVSVSFPSWSVPDAALDHPEHLSGLQTLGLYRTHVTDAALERLKGLTHLEELNLAGTQVTSAGLENLKGLTRLHTLRVIPYGAYKVP